MQNLLVRVSNRPYSPELPRCSCTCTRSRTCRRTSQSLSDPTVDVVCQSPEVEMSRFHNGMDAGLITAEWKKSARSNSQGNCVEMAALQDGQVAVRNSRFPDGRPGVHATGDRALILGPRTAISIIC